MSLSVGAAQAVASPFGSLPRGRLFAGLFLLTFLNAAAGKAVVAIGSSGFWPAFGALFNTSAVAWTALAAATALALQDDQETAAGPVDLALLVFVILAVLTPWHQLSGLALTVAALRAILSNPRESGLFRAGVVMLATSGALLWGNLLLLTLSRPVLQIDIWLMGALLGVHQEGNVLWREGSQVTAVVAIGCSSVHSVSVALVCWATVSQWFQAALDARAFATLAAAVAATVAINVARMGAILISPEWAHIVHDGWGASLVMWATLAAVVGICLFGFRRDVFARA